MRDSFDGPRTTAGFRPRKSPRVTCLTDAELLQFVEGKLSPEARAQVEAELDRCSACRALVCAWARTTLSGATSASDAAPVAGQSLGRFVVLDFLGTGAMGFVLTAHDPLLDRKVALKIVRPRIRSAEGSERLLMEAQALARVNHPHVLTVFDAGTAGDVVFLALERIEGTSVTQWARSKTPEAIVEVFTQLARGLHAAHQAGVIHRDVKPDNLMVGVDGRARVVDFGLAARSTDAGAPQLAGTPAYMAPELLAGAKPDARSDQFAFCVSLYEALEGALPFETVGSAALRPMKSRVPARVKQVVLRGLSSERFPSMQALAEALSARSSRRLVMAAVAAAGIAVFAWATSNPCAEVSPRVSSAWTERHRAQLASAFQASSRPWAETASREVGAALDRYVASLIAERRDACEATAVRHEQSNELLDARMTCLDRRLDAFESLVATLELADADVVDRAVSATQSLPSLESCRGTAAGSPDEETRRLLAAAEVALTTGRKREAETSALEAVGVADRSGRSSGKAEARFALAQALEETRPLDAERLYYDAAEEAARAKNDALVARAWIRQLYVVAFVSERFDAGQAIERLARTSLVRVSSRAVKAEFSEVAARVALLAGRVDDAARELEAAQQLVEPDSLQDARLEVAWLGLEETRGRYDEGEVHLRRALALRRRWLGDAHPDSQRLQSRLGSLRLKNGRAAEAERLLRESLRALVASVGPMHPTVAEVRVDLGNALLTRGDYDGAAEQFDEARAIRVARFGEASVDVARVMLNTASLAYYQGRFAPAEAAYRRSLETFTRVYGTDHPTVGTAHSGLGLALQNLERLDDAIVEHREAVRVLAARLGKHPRTADALGNLGLAQGAARRWGDAIATLNRALTMQEALLGASHLDLSYTLSSLGECLLEAGRDAEARGPLERSLKLRSENDIADLFRGETRFLLARLAWREGRRDEAVKLAREALGEVKTHPPLLQTIQSWLAAPASKREA